MKRDAPPNIFPTSSLAAKPTARPDDPRNQLIILSQAIFHDMLMFTHTDDLWTTNSSQTNPTQIQRTSDLAMAQQIIHTEGKHIPETPPTAKSELSAKPKTSAMHDTARPYIASENNLSTTNIRLCKTQITKLPILTSLTLSNMFSYNQHQVASDNKMLTARMATRLSQIFKELDHCANSVSTTETRYS